ncbi:KAP family P-loop NTPase fold protein [Vallitalea guaymasensis]|uniref:P-loop ATPase n=1 Tax=Vallitalea guaymasensis TaxID=1185412 RepID=A0A8J8M8B0_9FIRM|nr:P-loop NTPase fold protein [Vallitalea guaymasensis]QUH28204.1 P-loop ATPase [Vallitalea guaymasensis]
MRQHSKKNKYTYINYSMLLKSFFVGALISELFILVTVVDKVFWEFPFLPNNECLIWIIRVLYYLIIICYLYMRNYCKKMKVLIKSLRLDLLIFLVWGGILVFVFDGFGTISFENLLRTLAFPQLMALVLLPIIFCVSFFLRNQQVSLVTKLNENSLFMSDKEVESRSDDKFNFSDKADNFCEKVYNENSSEGLVFGIDAPWGTGKSTFVNLCKEYWNKKYKDEIIVYTFNPLRYENKEKMLDKFIFGLINEIKNHIFVPEIEWLISQYAKIIKDSKPSFSVMGLGFKLPSVNQSIDDIFERLESALKNIDKKIIIIIDDLDRLNFSAIKEMLFVIKKAFTLSNISYVLCYDTENIGKLEKTNFDTENVMEFLEKFINVKTSIFLDNKLLLKYFIDKKDESLSENIMADPVLISKAIEGVKDIFESNDYYRYLPFIGDARKLKRLINTILLLNIEKTDFDNCDFNKKDLTNLLLIYINYPNIFRTIYNTETAGKNGFFSVLVKDKEKYKNSSLYENYLRNLSENQKFILDEVFNVTQRIKDKTINQEILTSYACFNGSEWNGNNRNLERYLNLIINTSFPAKIEQYRFYVNCVHELLLNKTIEDLFNSKEFSLENGEDTHEQFWRTLVNNVYEITNYKKTKEIIGYALKNLNKYSLLKIRSFRETLIIFIVKLLNDIGWIDKNIKQYDNTDKNIAKIAEWIFGEGDFKEEGVLNILGEEEKGVLALYDILNFRISCHESRGLDIFNLTRALVNHINPKISVKDINKDFVKNEMREISQNIFMTFKSRYIEQQKNIFDEIDKLTLNDVGGYNSSNKIKGEGINNEFSLLKFKMKSFIIYQLGNTINDDTGIGCGYYDVSGNKDSKGINKEFNEYLFEICFKAENNSTTNYTHFLDYLLAHLSRDYVLDINLILNVLDKNSLITYWKHRRNDIKALKFESKNIQIITGSYTASYDKHLVDIYKVLDALLPSNE